MSYAEKDKDACNIIRFKHRVIQKVPTVLRRAVSSVRDSWHERFHILSSFALNRKTLVFENKTLDKKKFHKPIVSASYVVCEEIRT